MLAFSCAAFWITEDASCTSCKVRLELPEILMRMPCAPWMVLSSNRAVDAANRAIASPLLEDNTIQGAQGILINISGSSSLTLHEVHEASSVIQKAAHENANIIFGAVQDDQMKDTVKITVIAAGFKDVNRKNIHQKQSFLPKTWKAGREVPEEPVHHATSNVVHQVQQNVREVSHDVPADDLDVPTFLRRQAQKA